MVKNLTATSFYAKRADQNDAVHFFVACFLHEL